MLDTLYHQATRQFEAARSLPQKGSRHGHSFVISARSATLARAPLENALSAYTQNLDYRDLDPLFTVADDISLLAQCAQTLNAPADLHLHAGPQRGAARQADGTFYHWQRWQFEAAHQLPHVPAGHQCGRLHGHTFEVRLYADASLSSQAALSAAWVPCYAALHQQYLNALPGLENPTSERLAGWLWQRLVPTLPGLAAVVVFETQSAGCQFDGQDYRIWKTQHFESAVPLDVQGRYSGHSYQVRLHLCGPLDPYLGWTLDYSDVKTLFKPLYEALDHHAIDTLPGIEATDCASITAWISTRLAAIMPALERVDIFNRAQDGAIRVLRGQPALAI